MVAKQNLLHIKRRKTKKKDPCPICNYNLFLNSKFTQRIGLLDKGKDVIGWICPKCDSEFDLKDNIVYIYGENSIQGKA